MITAAADPRAASSIEQTSTGTPASSTTSAVPRADPFITAVPRKREGMVNVSSEPAAAAAASAADSQYAGPREPITGLLASPAVARTIPETPVAIAITHSRSAQPLPADMVTTSRWHHVTPTT